MQFRRVRVPGATYFFTVNLAERKKTLLTDHITQLREAVNSVKQRHPFIIDAVVILPDHLHMVMTLPANDANYSQRWNLIKSFFSRSLHSNERLSQSRQNKRERGIWQRRFWEHLIASAHDYEMHINYIHYNPVKHGYVDMPNDWPYSSIHRYMAEGVLPEYWAVDLTDLENEFGE